MKWFNIWKLINAIHHVTEQDKPYVSSYKANKSTHINNTNWKLGTEGKLIAIY